ncbi:MAG: CapA family protein [Acidimicrobiales bacterium]|nr:CapA family protein [Acidimicrobiales bacterium]RZV45782.1 MAG: CapA family protein [Acidimicrobiales bacterium]
MLLSKRVQGIILISLSSIALILIAILASGAFIKAAEPAVEVAGASLQIGAGEATTTTPPTTTTAAPTTTTPPPLRTATLAFTGDTLAHRGVVRQAKAYAADSELDYDFAPMYRLVEPYLSAADVAICHLETPLSIDNRNLSGYPVFNVPHELADGLAAAGYDGCSTASNHSLDRRPSGVFDTIDVLEGAGLQQTGMFRSAEERAEPTIYDAAGIAVAHLSYSYGFNGFTEPGDKPWLVNEIDIDQITADAAAARASGAEYVVVSLHWGIEYRIAPSSEQLEVGPAVLEIDDVDVIIGHHAHVVQPVGKVDDKFVVYGLGNFLSNQSANCCVAASQDGVIVQVHIQERRAAEATDPGFRTWLSYVPTWVDRDDFTIVPVVEALEDEELSDGRQATLEKSRARTNDAIGGLGARGWGVLEALR